MTTNYRRGYAFEQRVRKYLESCGFYVVRSAGSKGVADLVGFRLGSNEPPIFVQCKTDGVISSAERQRFWETSIDCSAVAYIASRNKRNELVFSLLKNGVDLKEVRLN